MHENFPPEITRERIDEIQLNKLEKDKEELLLGIYGECRKYAKLIANSREMDSKAIEIIVKEVTLWDWRHDNILAHIKVMLQRELPVISARLAVVSVPHRTFCIYHKKVTIDSFGLQKKNDAEISADEAIYNRLMVSDIFDLCKTETEKTIVSKLYLGLTWGEISNETGIHQETIRRTLKKIRKRANEDSLRVRKIKDACSEELEY